MAKKTREIILQQALSLFNEKGIEYGGLRELAKLLDIRVSNITYYFPTKDHLVAALAEELSALNDAVFRQYACDTPGNYLEMHCMIFRNQYQYRCLPMSIVHLALNSPMVAGNYAATAKKRQEKIKQILKTLRGGGYIESKAGEKEINVIVAHIGLIARFWVSEGIILHSGKRQDEIVIYYCTMLADILRSHATAKGRKDIDGFLKRLPGITVIKAK